MLVPLGVVTSTLTGPALERVGAVQVIVVELTTVKFVQGAPPTVTPVAPRNPVPVMVMTLPPEIRPELGDTEATAGATQYESAAREV